MRKVHYRSREVSESDRSSFQSQAKRLVFLFKNIFKILLNILFFILSLNPKPNDMITFNEKMTIEEATRILKFAGKSSFPNTDHNRKMIALAVKNHLKKLQGK